MSEEPENAPNANVRTPPYISYQTLLTFIDDLKTHGLPPQIDRSVLKRFSGGVSGQLMMALRSLGLMTPQNIPTDWLQQLVESHGKPGFSVALRRSLEHAYPFLARLNLNTATPSMFSDAFREAIGAKEDVLKKCRRFYLQAAKEAGVSIGPRILAGGRAPRSPAPSGSQSSPQRRPAHRRLKLRQYEPNGHSEPITIQQQLVGKYPEFDPSWPEPIQKAWFDGFQKLMATAEKQGGGE